MVRKILKIATISTGLLALAGADRVMPNLLTREYQRYSCAIRNSDLPVNSLERFLFSLMLATSRHTPREI